MEHPHIATCRERTFEPFDHEHLHLIVRFRVTYRIEQFGAHLRIERVQVLFARHRDDRNALFNGVGDLLIIHHEPFHRTTAKHSSAGALAKSKIIPFAPRASIYFTVREPDRGVRR